MAAFWGPEEIPKESLANLSPRDFRQVWAGWNARHCYNCYPG
jgi:hypothetical protein